MTQSDMDNKKTCVFVGHHKMVVTRAGDGQAPTLPTLAEVASLLPPGTQPIAVHAPQMELWAASVSQWADTERLTATEFRPLFFSMGKDDFRAACKAKQLAYWDAQSHYCPVCGHAMELMTDIAKKCPACGHETYPPISPAIIVRVERGTDEILLVKARNFRGDHYGLVAGFVETGETLEECVRREVKEETGLDIKDIRYAGNQPWPFPSGLMIGFVAQYAGGEITVQEEELTDARFFRRGELPAIPDKMSIARRLIDEWTGESD